MSRINSLPKRKNLPMYFTEIGGVYLPVPDLVAGQDIPSVGNVIGKIEFLPGVTITDTLSIDALHQNRLIGCLLQTKGVSTRCLVVTKENVQGLVNNSQLEKKFITIDQKISYELNTF